MRTGRSSRWTCTLAALAGAAISGPAGGAAAALPTLRVSLAIEDPDFKKTDGVPEAVAAFVRDEAGRHFQFLRWAAPPSAAEAPDTPDAELILGLAPRAAGAGGKRVVLTFTGRVPAGSGATVYELRDLTAEVYGPFDVQATHDAELLSRQITRVLAEQLARDVFRDGLLRDFLSHIPLATSIVADPELESIVLPVSWVELRASDASRLRVRFKASRPSGAAPRDGSIQMNPQFRHHLDPGAILCTVQEFTFLPLRKNAWHQEIPRILETRAPDSTAVFMERYELDPSAASRNERGDREASVRELEELGE